IVTTALGLIAQAILNVPLSSVPGKLQLGGSPVSAPDFQYLGIGLPGLSFLTRAGGAALLTGLLATLSLMLSDFFDTAGTFPAGGDGGRPDDRRPADAGGRRAGDPLGGLLGRPAGALRPHADAADLEHHQRHRRRRHPLHAAPSPKGGADPLDRLDRVRPLLP